MRKISFLNRYCSKSTVGYQLKIVIDNRTVSKRVMTGKNSGYVPEFFILSATCIVMSSKRM